ncbi:Rha family transcriptional regulator [Xenorhabdus sp. BG5]|nr:Rha family transcriptional regulator [Xenorhabdus sp. BG5]
MSSIEISELVSSRHDNVKVAIERLAKREIIRLPAMQDSEIINNLGLKSKVQHYVFSGEQGKRDSIIVVAQLSPEFTARLVDRWQELEKQLEDKKVLPSNYIEALEHLLASEKEKITIAAERDHAIETKAWIGNKREATAMATASAAVRERNKLAEILGESKKRATILAIERLTGKKYSWRPLKKWCLENNTEPHLVHDERFGTVKSWPAEAWLSAYRIDLSRLL